MTGSTVLAALVAAVLSATQGAAVSVEGTLTSPDVLTRTVVAAGSSSVTGTVTYRERIALLPDAVVVVRIWDVTRREDWLLIGKQALTNVGQSPIRFSVDYRPDRVRPDGDYIVEARILVGSQLRWINTAGCPVLTKGYPAAVSVVVRPFTVGAQSVALTSRPIPDCRYDRR